MAASCKLQDWVTSREKVPKVLSRCHNYYTNGTVM